MFTLRLIHTATAYLTLAALLLLSSSANADLAIHFDPNILPSQYGPLGQEPAALYENSRWITDVRSTTPGGLAFDDFVDAEGNADSPVILPHPTQGAVWNFNGTSQRLIARRDDTVVTLIGNQDGFGGALDTNTLTTIVAGRIQPGATGTRFLFDMVSDFADFAYGLQYSYDTNQLLGFANQSTNAAVNLPVDEWFVATYAWNGAASTASLSVQTQSGTVSNTASASSNALLGTADLRIGRRSDFATGTYFAGNMGDFMIFNDVNDHSTIAAELATEYFSGPALELVVDLNTEAFLVNNSNNGIYIDGYRIASQQGSLAPANWTSLENSGFDTNLWFELGSTASELSEGVLALASFIPAGASIPLGDLFNTSVNVRDLVFDYHIAGADPETYIEGEVTYIDAEGLPGDFNSDGKVNLADYTVWRDNLGSNSPLANDDNLGTPVGATHYQLWKTNFGSSSPGALSAGSAAVPEPTTCAMLLMGSLSTFVVRRRMVANR
ncbi:hypothetical protein [Aeoliella sp. SH292]|uniref:hypothetical protein n=1 Tax=Aeoliella sp. SH292 TaxID=3454464 RepID=UPI003F995602